MGGKKPSKVKTNKVKSAFKGVDTFNTNLGGFGGTSAFKQGNAINVNSSLGGALQPSFDEAARGQLQQLGLLNQGPEAQLSQIGAGQNAYYNLNKELLARETDRALADAQLRFSRGGLQDSSSRGAFEGSLINDSVLRDLALQQAAVEQTRNAALQSLGANQSTLTNLANFQLQPFNSAQSGLMSAFQGNDAVNLQNASNQLAASQANAQLEMQANAQRQAMIGSLVGAGLTAAALPFTGGASLGGLGSLFKGGGSSTPYSAGVSVPLGGSISPNFSFSRNFLGSAF